RGGRAGARPAARLASRLLPAVAARPRQAGLPRPDDGARSRRGLPRRRPAPAGGAGPRIARAAAAPRAERAAGIAAAALGAGRGRGPAAAGARLHHEPRGPTYVAGLSIEDTAAALAKACGHWGTGAEYLLNTVQHLEALGIHDRFLWQLQQRVAEKIRSAEI